MDKYEQMDALAQDILKLSRNTLLVNLRFLDTAMSMFSYVSCPDGTIPKTDISIGGGLAVNGKKLFYEPKWVLKRYRNEKEAVVRDYLHMVFHCVFHHAFVSTLVDIPRWNLACDIAVESAIEELDVRCAQAKRSISQQGYITQLRSAVNRMTAEKIYAYLCEKPLSIDELAKMQQCFRADSHDIWYMRTLLLQTDSAKQRAQGGKGSPEQHSRTASLPGNRFDDVSSLSEAMNGLKDEWEKIARRILTDIKSFSKLQGDRGGSMVQALREVTREKYDYADFLRRFSVLGEMMKVNDDEFDYIFYTYGLKLYEKMPLIEPLEYKEVKRVKELVVAIDTSGSVVGDIVQRFINKTYNILKQQENFFTKINLHIVQCDAEIQEDHKITCQEEFDEYLKTMKIRGLGGTDFRPVFDYVDRLKMEKEFVNLKGLIYFTDGWGTFPAKKPDYHTAFVFIDDEYNNPDVPVWAIKLVLQKDEI